MNDIESRLSAIEERNKRVELGKNWEISWTRRLLIAALTYTVVLAYLVLTKNSQPFVNALIPPTGFILSTLAIKSVKDLWQRNHN